jgi:hypothetical protein
MKAILWRSATPDISPMSLPRCLRAGLAPCKIKVLKQFLDFARRQGRENRVYHKIHHVVIPSTAEVAVGV